MKIKHFLLGLFLLAFAGNAFAQDEGDINLGAGLIYGTDIESVGLNAHGQYFIMDNLGIYAGLNYFFPERIDLLGVEFKTTFWALNFNANYYFDLGTDIRPYALAGVNILNGSQSVEGTIVGVPLGAETSSSTNIGLNLGGGIDIDTGGALIPFGQIKYVASEVGQLVLMGGVRFRLNN